MSLDPRILFVDQTGELGGAELCLADLAIHLKSHCTVFLFEPGPFQELLESSGVRTLLPEQSVAKPKVGKNSNIIAYVSAIPAFTCLLVSLSRVARGFDLLYANTAKALMTTAITASFLRKPFLFHLHDIIDAEHFNRLNRWLLVLGANLATGIVVNSKATAEAYRKAGGRNRNLVVVPNGFQMERFRAEVELLSQEIRASLGIGNRALVGMFGRITAWKGQKTLIEALSRLSDVTALIVGEALFTDEDRRYKRELVALADRLGVASRVHFVGFQPDILPFLKAVDLVVHCSTSPEPFGRVIVEALLAGKPVIATRWGGPAEIIEDGLTGILVDPGDPGELASAMERLLSDRLWAETLAERGGEAAARRYNLESILVEWRNFINRGAHRAVTTLRLKSSAALKRSRTREREAKLTGA